jgi:hypothetical protein
MTTHFTHILIDSYAELTDDFIHGLADEVFTRTGAFRAFRTKEQFVSKIYDRTTRYTMLADVLICIPMVYRSGWIAKK